MSSLAACRIGSRPGHVLAVSVAAARELGEETGLGRVVTHGLVVDQVAANPDTGAPEGVNVVCDGGTMSAADAEALSLPIEAMDEIEALAWIRPDDLHAFALPFMERRIRAAVAAALVGYRFPLLYNGEPAEQPTAA
ncbi:hypothetical protein [Kitasatospora sp. NPDC093806]|uniref:hypothetical protein n=1 Tax=Kitasatospora sp. NPDC093806 TaxID=3155075 RepID=UPI003419DF7B